MSKYATDVKFDIYIKSVKTCNLIIRFLKYVVTFILLSKVIALGYK